MNKWCGGRQPDKQREHSGDKDQQKQLRSYTALRVEWLTSSMRISQKQLGRRYEVRAGLQSELSSEAQR